MTIDVRSRPEVPARSQRLADAVAVIGTALPKEQAIRATAFDFEEKAFVRSTADHVVWARRDLARDAWTVRCHSLDTDWSSATYRLAGSMPVDDVLELGEAMWRRLGPHPRPLSR